LRILPRGRKRFRTGKDPKRAADRPVDRLSGGEARRNPDIPWYSARAARNRMANSPHRKTNALLQGDCPAISRSGAVQQNTAARRHTQLQRPWHSSEHESDSQPRDPTSLINQRASSPLPRRTTPRWPLLGTASAIPSPTKEVLSCKQAPLNRLDPPQEAHAFRCLRFQSSSSMPSSTTGR
jgi:hypothetical protein